jgi:hypothetical protein
VQGQAVASPQGQVIVDLKDYLQHETISRLFLRVRGTVNQNGAAGGAGVATGRDNPEALIVNVTARHTPALGVVSKNALTPRGFIAQGKFDRGYAITGTALTDPNTAAVFTPSVDYILPLVFKMPGATNPIEWALPMSAFSSYQLTVTVGGKEQLFSGGTTTWDPSGLNIELWADIDDGVAGVFHLLEEFEQTVPILATQPDFQILLEKGFYYTHLLFIANTANARDNTVINGITVQSAGRVWTPQGDKNAPVIQRWNRESHVVNAAEDLNGIYFIPALRDGMFTRAIDATLDRVECKLDVTFGAGPTNIIVRARRISPQALQVRKAA